MAVILAASRAAWDHIATVVLAAADASVGRRTSAAIVWWRKVAVAISRKWQWLRIIRERKPLVSQAGSSCALPVAAIVYIIFGHTLTTSDTAISPSAQAVRMRFVARTQAVGTAFSMVCMMTWSRGHHATIVSFVHDIMIHSNLRRGLSSRSQ